MKLSDITAELHGILATVNALPNAGGGGDIKHWTIDLPSATPADWYNVELLTDDWLAQNRADERLCIFVMYTGEIVGDGFVWQFARNRTSPGDRYQTTMTAWEPPTSSDYWPVANKLNQDAITNREQMLITTAGTLVRSTNKSMAAGTYCVLAWLA